LCHLSKRAGVACPEHWEQSHEIAPELCTPAWAEHACGEGMGNCLWLPVCCCPGEENLVSFSLLSLAERLWVSAPEHGIYGWDKEEHLPRGIYEML